MPLEGSDGRARAGEREAAVLFADLSGFTALTEAHGDLDAADLAARFYALATAALCAETRLVKTIGDAVMLLAPSPRVGVGCALRLAGAVATEPQFPAVRIGVHAGPVVERAGDVFGATVNVAARVAAFARSGQILVTRAVADAIAADRELAIRPLGSITFKNVTEPVELFELAPSLSACIEVDPVCRMRVDARTAAAELTWDGVCYHFCSAGCAARFAACPTAHVPQRVL